MIMDYKEKYNRLLDAIKELQKANPSDDGIQNWINDNVPELKESEDEKIRKALIRFHKSSIDIDGIKGEDIIAWLEKQGERKDAAKYGYKFAVEKACEWIRQQKEMLEDSFSDVNDFADLLKEAMEEKQGSPVLSNSSNIGKGEQKPTDSYCRENCKGFQETGKCFADGDCKTKREAESIDKVDKVEPKFHEGDWITNGDYTWKIVEVMPLDYTLQSQDGNTIVDDTISYVDEQFHSFTVKDARDGDVLITVDNERPFIFKGCLDPNHPDSPVAYCGIDTEGYFCVGESKFNYWWTDEKVHPATKEQRNLLFQKMKEAGYEWNSENKVLNKIVQKSIKEEAEKVLSDNASQNEENTTKQNT